MKRVILIIIICLLITLTSSCAKTNITEDLSSNLENSASCKEPLIEVEREYCIFTGSMSDDSYIEELKVLESKSSIIISGEVTKKRQVMFDNGDFSPTGITVSTIKIDNILKSDNKISEDLEIDILEYYWTEKNEEKEKIFTYDYYVPTNIGEKYLLFLSDIVSTDYDDPAKYTPTVLWMGKYPLSTQLYAAYNDKKIISDEVQKYSEINGAPSNYVNILNEILNNDIYNKLWAK